jgi:hypothetical protein
MINIGDLVQFKRDCAINPGYSGDECGIVFAVSGDDSCIKVHWILTGGDWLGVCDSNAWFHRTLMMKV